MNLRRASARKRTNVRLRGVKSLMPPGGWVTGLGAARHCPTQALACSICHGASPSKGMPSLRPVRSCVSQAFDEGTQRITNEGAERPVEFMSSIHTLSVDPRNPSHVLFLYAARRWKCVSLCLAIDGLLAAMASNARRGRPAFLLCKD